MNLGVNIDHIATIREARKTDEPDPVFAAYLAELAGADGITVHLREDRRHIQDRDLEILGETVSTSLNLEMALAPDIVEVALEIVPDQATLVPEKREEVTTEGGLDVLGNKDAIAEVVAQLKDAGSVVSLFIEPTVAQIDASLEVGADAIEIHTGAYANAGSEKEVVETLRQIQEAAKYAHGKGLTVNAGHGLTYNNVRPVVEIPEIVELNIGHSIIARAAFVGIERAVKEMIALLKRD